jgi:hypothetical protein
VPLTQAERAAGRKFLSGQAAVLASVSEQWPPDARCSPYGPPWFRHDCPRGRAGTTALHLGEVNSGSPAFGDVPAGRFVFTYLEGRCRACGYAVRSGSGYLTVKEVESSA